MAKEEEKHEVVVVDSVAVAKMESTPAPMNVGDMGLLPVEQQKVYLKEYDNRRDFFLEWLLGHLKEGTHYGHPPGCAPAANVDPRQWTAKPGLYKSGALLIVDLLKLKPKYESDLDSWKMSGEEKGLFFRKCILHSSDGKVVIGEGTGAFKINEKKMSSANACIKMADKRALVAAVINSIPVVGDLFTQDLDDIKKPTDRMNYVERKHALLAMVEDELIERASKWSGTATGWLQEAVASFQNDAGSSLKTTGAVTAFENALKNGEIDWDTGNYTKNKE